MPGDGLADGTRVAVWWDYDRAGLDRNVPADWYAGSVQLVLRTKAGASSKQHAVVLYDDGDEICEPIDVLRHWAGERASPEDTTEVAVDTRELRDLDFALNGSELNEVEEEDSKEDSALIDESDRLNWDCIQRAMRRRQRAAPFSLVRASINTSQYDCIITSEDCELSGRKLSAAERAHVADIAIGYKALRAAVQGAKQGKGPRMFHVPRRMSLLHCARLSAGLRRVAPQISVTSVSSSPADDFTTLLLHLPPVQSTSVSGCVSDPLADTSNLPLKQSNILCGAASVWIDAASTLRGVAFGLQEADLFVPSRGTLQFFGGYDANAHKAEAILRQAMGVHQGGAYVGGIEHPDLRIPTLVASSYVTSGSVPLGEWLSVVSLARRKHECVSSCLPPLHLTPLHLTHRCYDVFVACWQGSASDQGEVGRILLSGHLWWWS